MIEKFIEENLYITEDFIRIPIKEVYERYYLFCRHYKISQMRRKEFYIEMAKHGIKRHEKTPSVFAGWYIQSCKY